MAKMDKVGGIIFVERSSCPSLVGVKGMVARETARTFLVALETDRVVRVPKRGSVFCLALPDDCGLQPPSISLDGDAMAWRSSNITT